MLGGCFSDLGWCANRRSCHDPTPDGCAPVFFFFFCRLTLSPPSPYPEAVGDGHIATIIDGKAIAATIRGEIKAEVEKLASASGGGVPGLAVVLVGARGDSETYVRSKVKACEEVGIESFASYLPESVTQEELLKVSRFLFVLGVYTSRAHHHHTRALLASLRLATLPVFNNPGGLWSQRGRVC